MGQPSSTQVYQQPTKAELDANKLSNQQKTAALAKINQAVRGESMGLRGMGGLYEWAGPTPWMAGDPKARPKPQPTKPAGGEGGPGGFFDPGGRLKDVPGSPIYGTPAAGIHAGVGTAPGYISGAGPRGDRGPGGTGPMVYASGAGPKGDRGAPGWVPAPATKGPVGDRSTGLPAPTTYQQRVTQGLYQHFGLKAPPVATPPAKPSVVAPPPANPATYAQRAWAEATGQKPPAAVPPKAQPTVAQTQPPPVRAPSASPVSARPVAGPIVSPAPPATRTQPTITPPKPVAPISRPSIFQTLGRIGGGGPRGDR